MKQPLVSVIVHTRNSERTILSHLKSIKLQSYKNIEIIGVDNFSSDKTPRILKKHVDKFFSAGPERSAQRNFGAKKSQGKYLFFPDSDMVLDKNVVRDCVALLEEEPKIKMVIIPEKSFGSSYWAKCKALERSCYVGDDAIEAARFFDRVSFEKVGGYDEEITGPEDWDLPRRMSKISKNGRIKSYILHDEGSLRLSTVIQKKYYYGKRASYYLSKNTARSNIVQTIYFLRPAFYRNWQKLIRNPHILIGMVLMLFLEQIAGGIGYFTGKYSRK